MESVCDSLFFAMCFKKGSGEDARDISLDGEVVGSLGGVHNCEIPTSWRKEMFSHVISGHVTNVAPINLAEKFWF